MNISIIDNGKHYQLQGLSFRYSAIDDETDEVIGQGATVAEAIADAEAQMAYEDQEDAQ